MQASPSVNKNRPNFFVRLLDNPIVLKELKGRMRGRQGATLLTVYLGLLSLFIVMVYLFLEYEGGLSQGSPDFLQKAGKALFGTVVLTELLLIAFIAPALTSGAISSERERQTFDLLRVSLLSPRHLIMGKLGSAAAYLLLLIFTAIPIQSLAFFLGGVGMEEMLVSILMLVVSAFFFCALGLYFSTIAKRPLTATIFSYAALLLPVLFLVLLFFLVLSSAYALDEASPESQILLARFVWTLYSTNPLIAAFGGEMLLVEEHVLFVYFLPPPGRYLGALPIILLSPWLIYAIYAVTMTVLMIRLSIFYLKRYEY
jgi:ABC-type transport system involved in multi-copper enzyme maturation permease subunit